MCKCTIKLFKKVKIFTNFQGEYSYRLFILLFFGGFS